ncbi:MAG: glutaredoxin 3 [Deltaproteobacteria bacterium]|nr:glutaredoxin 3 [Deltaproteobacteria bacterium]
MAAVTIYTTMYCPYCHAAKDLLTEKGVAFTEVDVTRDPSERVRLAERTGQRTVPQIFIDERSIGGYDELAGLERRGELDALLG